MERKRQSAFLPWMTAFVTVLLYQASGKAQWYEEAMSRYLHQGADATSVPRGKRPGADYFSHGADATGVPTGDQPGADYFSRGAEATSVPAGGQSGAAYFSHGADATSVPTGDQPGAAYFSHGADATSVPAGDQPGAAYFSHGADATRVPTGNQPGAAYFSHGADVTSVTASGQFVWPPVSSSVETGEATAPPSSTTSSPASSTPPEELSSAPASLPQPVGATADETGREGMRTGQDNQAEPASDSLVSAEPPDTLGSDVPAAAVRTPQPVSAPLARGPHPGPAGSGDANDGWFASALRMVIRGGRILSTLFVTSLALLLVAGGAWAAMRWRRRKSGP